MPYRIAGIDVHKKRLAVVVADVEVDEEYQFERRSASQALHGGRRFPRPADFPEARLLSVSG